MGAKGMPAGLAWTVKTVAGGRMTTIALQRSSTKALSPREAGLRGSLRSKSSKVGQSRFS